MDSKRLKGVNLVAFFWVVLQLHRGKSARSGGRSQRPVLHKFSTVSRFFYRVAAYLFFFLLLASPCPSPPPHYTGLYELSGFRGTRWSTHRFFPRLRASTAAKRLEATLPAPKGERNLVPFRGKRSNGSKRIIFFPPGSIRYVFSSLSWPYSGERSMISNGLASLADYHFLACGRAPVLIFPITGRPVLLCVYNAR